MRRVIAVVVWLLCALPQMSWAQINRADSLHRLLASKKIADTTRIEALIQLADFYCEVNADTAMIFATQAKTLVDQKKITRLLPRALRYIAIILVVKGEYDLATSYLHQAIRQSPTDSSRFVIKEKALAYNLLGVITNYKSKTDSALYYYFKSLNIFIRLNEKIGIANRNNNIATVYREMGNYPLALKYFFQSYQTAPSPRAAQNIGKTYMSMNEIVKAKYYLLTALKLYDQDNELDNTGVAYVNEELGNLYSSAGKSDSAIFYLTRALRINERAQHQNGIAQDHYYFGLHYKNNAEWSQAKEEAEKAIHLHRAGGEKYGIAESILLLSQIEYQLKQNNQALVHASEGQALALFINAKELQKGFLEVLTLIYEANKDFNKAFAYSRQLNQLKDSINNEEKIKQVANMEALYENDKKEKELALVRAQKLAADAQLGEEETKATFLIVGLSLVTLVLVVGAFAYIALKKNRGMLAAKNEELRKLNQTKDRFFAIVGHDLRGPITSFSGINDLLNWHISKNDLEKVKAFGSKITQSARQLDTLLNNLLSWAMSQTDAVPYRPEPIQLRQLTQECFGFFQHSLELKQIQFSDRTTDDLFVFADKNALSTVLRNLLSNAIKFTPLNGAITLDARLAGDFVWMDVRDTGVGVPQEKMATLFALSENKTTSGTSGEKGTGLGLMLCAEYVALNKGTINVNSEVGKGTVFSFSTPSFQPKELQELKKEMIHG
ncbi:MAG: tetratricopeptide repeat-containing sensor histidine kinase [Bacteroidetes bacterium]|nr:tetratricopeptide repeat-containing sensor histidine kinase [Bacteroidota bacterium]